ncbi:MAG TPA: ABC transporter permease [Candidatus Eisenbacteria bacterium]|nr:ABC transporter permease [Candidatus Eisenbacteria bacterium]
MNGPRLRAIVWKEFVQMRRDKATLAMMLGIPVLQLLLFGYAIRTDVRHLPLAVYDASRTLASRTLIEQFVGTGNFTVRMQVDSYGDALRALDDGRVHAAVVIPPGYARDVARGRPAAVQVLVDASDPLASQNAIAAATLVGQRASLERLQSRLPGTAAITRIPIEVRVRPLYNPALRTAIYIVPGIIGMILSITLMIITSVAIVRERERGTLEQLVVTPLTRSEIMVGKIAPYVGVGYVQMTAVLLVGQLVFRVPLRGDVLLLYAETLLFIVASLGLGLFVSTLARTQSQAMQASYFFVMPSVLLSGFMFPREGMPPVARQIGLAIPLTYYLQILRGVMLRGVGIAALWPQTLMLALFALVFFGFSVGRFRKQLE